MLGLTTLLAKPQLIIGVVITVLLAMFILYFFYSQHEIKTIEAKLAVQIVQTQQDSVIINDLNKRIVLAQQLNQNFNKAVNEIRQKQIIATKALNAYNLSTKTPQDAQQTELFLNNRTNQLFSDLNLLSLHNSKVEK